MLHPLILEGVCVPTELVNQWGGDYGVFEFPCGLGMSEEYAMTTPTQPGMLRDAHQRHHTERHGSHLSKPLWSLVQRVNYADGDYNVVKLWCTCMPEPA